MRREVLHQSITLADNSQKPLINKINAEAGWKTTGDSGAMYLSDGMEAINWSIFGNQDDADVITCL